MIKRLFFLLTTGFLWASNDQNLQDVSGPTFDSSYQTAIWKTTIILFSIIVGAFIILWLYRKYGQSRLRMSNQTKSIQILERRALSQKTMLFIIEVNGKQVLIAESQNQVTSIRNLDWNNPQESKL